MPLNKDEAKEAMKAAIREWLDERYLTFGKFTARAISCALLAAVLYFILKMSGWSLESITPQIVK